MDYRNSFDERLQIFARAWADRYTLTSGELDVLVRTAEGESRDLIALSRGCSPLTVKKHIANLLQKTADDSLHLAAIRLIREAAMSQALRRYSRRSIGTKRKHAEPRP